MSFGAGFDAELPVIVSDDGNPVVAAILVAVVFSVGQWFWYGPLGGRASSEKAGWHLPPRWDVVIMCSSDLTDWLRAVPATIDRIALIHVFQVFGVDCKTLLNFSEEELFAAE